ncbi:ABC transporter ATP-binding protein [Streptomyces sp. NPDC005963]|uniref:ABC transporter ATP-binding protein n=1 Tax=Streptomyces sp. NPDC005963 TaxID=3156721 RepID=UPI0033C07C84
MSSRQHQARHDSGPAEPGSSAPDGRADSSKTALFAAVRNEPTNATAGEESERILLPVATPARTRAAVAELLRPHRILAVAGFTIMVIATAVGLLTQPLLGRIVDIAAGQRPPDALTTTVLLLAAVAVVQGLTTAVGLSLVSRLGESLLAQLRERFIERALGLPLEEVERAGSGDLTVRVTGDVSLTAEAVRHALPELARSLLAIVLTLGALAVLDWRFLLAALLALPVQLHTARWYVRRAVPLYAKQRIANGAQQQQLLDTIGGSSTVRAFRLEKEHTEQVEERSRAVVGLTMRGVHLVLRFYSRLHIAEYIGLTAVLGTGFLLVRADAASVGTATAAALYFHSLFGPVNSALVLIDDAQSAVAGLSRIIGVADRPLPKQPNRPLIPKDASVAVSDVSHSYRSGHQVLRDITMELHPGERVALVGASGAGKTTLAKLIAGIHEPAEGHIALGAVPLHHIGPGAIRRTVALITQETHVFAGPLADDLRLARPDATDDELRAALDRVDALAWVEALPEGLGTVVGEGGHRLSGGQTQTLALARLVLADPPVVILDEATAEAGSTGARALEKAVARAIDGRTALIVAHRLTQAAAADRIVVMDAGRIVETGTHDELCNANGPYAILWEAWSGSRRARDEAGLPEFPAHSPAIAPTGI